MHRPGFEPGASMVVMPEIGHDVLTVLVAVLTVAIFAMMIWAGRVH
jgi:hypothetical protein